MGEIRDLGRTYLRQYVTDGVPSTGFNKPNKGQGIATFDAIDAAVSAATVGMRWTTAVRVATTANGTLASAFENGDTVDGVVLATGNRILIKNQTAATENGVYVVAASGAPTRATDADLAAEFVGLTVYVQEGTANAGRAFTCTNATAPTLGVTDITFVEVFDIGTLVTEKADQTDLDALDVRVTENESDIAALEVAATAEALARSNADINLIGSVGGTVNAITGTVTGTDASNRIYELIPVGNSTGPATLALNGGTALPILDATNQQVALNGLRVARRYLIQNFANTSYRLMYPAISHAEFDAAQLGIATLNARTISAGGMLTGGGDLSANRTISLVEATAEQMRAGTSHIAGASAANVRPLIEELSRPIDFGRPGDAPWRYMSATAGVPEGQTSYTTDDVVTTASGGRFIRKTGAHIVSPVHGYYMLPGRKYLVRAYVSRNTIVADPSGHAVQLKVRWLNGFWASISASTVQTVSDLQPGSGKQLLTGVVSTAAASDVTHVSPSDTVYCRPYIEWFGDDGVNQTEEITWADITDLTGYDPDLTSLTGRVTSLETIDAGPRLEAVEAAVSGATSVTYETLDDAINATIPGTAEIMTVLSFDGSAKARRTEWRRVGSAPTDGTTYIENLDGGSFWRLDSGRGVAYILWTGQSNAQQGYYAGSAESDRSPRAKIWDTTAAAWVDIEPGVGGLNVDNPNHSLYVLTQRMIDELGYFEVRVIYEAFGGRPVEQWAGIAAIPATAEIALSGAVTHDSLAASFDEFNDGDTLTLHDALAGGGSAIRTLAISGTTTIRDVLTWIRLEANIRAGLDINGQKIILEADDVYSISSNESGGGDFDTVDLDFTPADRTLDSGTRPMATLIVDKCTAAGVVRFDYVFWTQGEADTSTVTDPKFWPIEDETTYLPQWVAWVKDFEDRGLFTRDTKYIVNGLVDGIYAGPQAVANRILRHLPLMHENVAVVSSSGLLGFDEGHVDAGGFSYRNHFSGETDTEELGHRDFAAVKAFEEGGQPTNHNLYPYTEIMRPDGSPGSIGYPLLLTSGAAFIATARHFRGTSIRCTSTTTIHLDDRQMHPVYKRDFGREVEIYSVSTGAVITIETANHEIFDELGDILNTTRYIITRRGAGMVRLRYVIGQWRIVADTFTKDWDNSGGTITPSGTKVFTRDECMGMSYILNAGDYELPAADVSMARMRVLFRTNGIITLKTTTGAIYAGQGSPNFAPDTLTIPANQVIELTAIATQRWGITGGTWQAELRQVISRTTDLTLTRNETGKTYNNIGATALVNFNLPAAEAGLIFRFNVMDADGIRATASSSSGDIIRDGATVGGSGSYIQSTTIGDSITLEAQNTQTWLVVAKNGAGWAIT